jgi:hypothetical protein
MSRKEKIERDKKRLKMYLEKEAYMLSRDGIQSYGMGTRNAARYDLDLAEIRKGIETLEREIEELEGLEAGEKPRKIVGVLIRDW